MIQKKKLFSKTYVSLVFLFLYIPIICVVIYSFNTSKSTAVWGGFTLDWYSEMVRDRRLMEALFVSIQVAVGATLISIIFGTIGAIALDRINNKAKTFLSGLLYVPLIVPEIILGIAILMFFSLFPFVKFGVFTLILSHTTFCVPYIFLLVSIRLKPLITPSSRPQKT